MALRQLKSNWSKGELSPQIEGRSDLAAFYNGCSIAENFWLFYEGGAFRRYGTRFIAEVKDSTKETRGIPFIFSNTDSYIIEAGHLYFRFFRRDFNGDELIAPIKISAGASPLEIVTPYEEADLPDLQWRQIGDVLYIVHPDYQPRKLIRVSDTSWTLSLFVPNPPPTFEADTDISGGTVTLTLGATTGSSVAFTASSAVFLEGDVGRYVIIGAGRGLISGFGTSAGDTTSPNTTVRVDILDAFASVGPHAAGTWLLRLSPQTTLDPNRKEPVGAQVVLQAGVNAFRTADVGKYISIYGGLVKITQRDSVSQVRGEILSILSDSEDANPAAAPAGSWALRVPSWSDALGWPRTIEFHQGRLTFGGTRSLPTTFWQSSPDDFENFAIGALADNAVEHTIASGRINIIEWLRSLRSLFIGDAESERSAKGRGVDTPIGGDEIPFIGEESDGGSIHAMPLVMQRALLFLQTYAKRVIELTYRVEDDGFFGQNLMLYSRHIGDAGFRQHPLVYAKEPFSIVHVPRADGQLACLTYYRAEQVAGWTRLVTDGEIESAVITPNRLHGYDDVTLFVKRTINGATKRFVEHIEHSAPELEDREWPEFHTDCAKVAETPIESAECTLGAITGAGVTFTATGAFTVADVGKEITNLEGSGRAVIVEHVTNNEVVADIQEDFDDLTLEANTWAVLGKTIAVAHLEGKTVDVIADDSYIGQKTVSAGVVTLDETYRVAEVGLHYGSTLRTMRPALPNAIIDGLPRHWTVIFVQLLKSFGGKVNNQEITYPAAALNTTELRTGIFQINPEGDGKDLDGYVTIEQDSPLPFQVLSMFGTLQVGDHQ